MIVMWGLKNCDTCRRARHWLEARHVTCEFRDLRKQTPEPSRLTRWLKQAGAETLINRRGTTWRALSASARRQIEAGDIIAVLERHPSLMKRPILEHSKQVLVGFDPTIYKLLAEETE